MTFVAEVKVETREGSLEHEIVYVDADGRRAEVRRPIDMPEDVAMVDGLPEAERKLAAARKFNTRQQIVKSPCV